MVSICPVFKWLGCLVFKQHLTTRTFCILPLFGHLNTKHVRHSEFHCTLRHICLVESALLQMLFVFTTLYCCGFLVNCFHAQFVFVFISFILKLFLGVLLRATICLFSAFSLTIVWGVQAKIRQRALPSCTLKQ